MNCTCDFNKLLNVIKHDILNHRPLAPTQRGLLGVVCSSIAHISVIFFIYISPFVLVEKNYLSSANANLEIIIHISFAINWYRLPGSIVLLHNYIKLISSSWLFSMKDSSKLSEFELVLKGSMNKKKKSAYFECSSHPHGYATWLCLKRYNLTA